jgi:hypothetical protein
MIPTPVITAMSNVIVLTLTPTQRWNAASRFNNNPIKESRFIIIAIVLLGISSVLLYAVSYYRNVQERKAINRLFVEYAEKRGLSKHERQILLNIASNAGLKRREAIFTMSSAFDHGAAKIMKKSKQLKTELSFLREKLGFQNQSISSKLKKPSSRHIPAGKKLLMTRRKAPIPGDIESTVIENNDMELRVKSITPMEITPGEFWRVRYHFGASVWEFDTSVVSCDGDVLVLSHNDNVRFINRRRFLRVPVNKPAFIARFPFKKTLVKNNNNKKESSKVWQVLANASGDTLKPPEFVPAVITELAGPGLRIETPLEVKKGERVLVVFELDEEKDEVSISKKKGETLTLKIIEDIGEVRHIEAAQNRWSVAVELVGLSDSEINELIRATNVASLKASTRSQDTSNSMNAEEHTQEPVSVEGA